MKPLYYITTIIFVIVALFIGSNFIPPVITELQSIQDCDYINQELLTLIKHQQVIIKKQYETITGYENALLYMPYLEIGGN